MVLKQLGELKEKQERIEEESELKVNNYKWPGLKGKKKSQIHWLVGRTTRQLVKPGFFLARRKGFFGQFNMRCTVRGLRHLIGRDVNVRVTLRRVSAGWHQRVADADRSTATGLVSSQVQWNCPIVSVIYNAGRRLQIYCAVFQLIDRLFDPVFRLFSLSSVKSSAIFSLDLRLSSFS